MTMAPVVSLHTHQCLDEFGDLFGKIWLQVFGGHDLGGTFYRHDVYLIFPGKRTPPRCGFWRTR